MKKGFTIIELLVVIGILGMLMVFAIPVVNNVQNEALKKIQEQEVNNLNEAAKTLLLDLEDPYNKEIQCNSNEIKCDNLSNNVSYAVIGGNTKTFKTYFEDKNNNFNEIYILYLFDLSKENSSEAYIGYKMRDDSEYNYYYENNELVKRYKNKTDVTYNDVKDAFEGIVGNNTYAELMPIDW